MSDLTQADLDSCSTASNNGRCTETPAPLKVPSRAQPCPALHNLPGDSGDCGLSDSFTRIVSLEDWVNSGRQWPHTEHLTSPEFEVFHEDDGAARGLKQTWETEPLVPASLLNRQIATGVGSMQSQHASSAASTGGGAFNKGRVGPRTSVSSMDSSGQSVQSPPGFERSSAYGLYPLMPASGSTMQGQHTGQSLMPERQFMPGPGAQATGRNTPSSFNHFRFPSVPQTSVRMLPSQRLGLTPSPIGMGRGGRQPRPQYNFCVFCKNNGEDEKFYMTHTLKDDSGLVRCPVLCNYVCPICGATGKIAHTIRYCPKNKDDRYHDNYAPITMLKEMRSSTGKPRTTESVESMFYPSESDMSTATSSLLAVAASGVAGSSSAPNTMMHGGAGARSDRFFRPVVGQSGAGSRRNSTNSPSLFEYHNMMANQRQQPF